MDFEIGEPEPQLEIGEPEPQLEINRGGKILPLFSFVRRNAYALIHSHARLSGLFKKKS